MFLNKLGLASGDTVTTMTAISSRVIRLEMEVDGQVQAAVLNTAECDALILVLKAAVHLADVYKAGDL
ncbi:MAG: hypothetical protein Q7U38_14245 [Methylobacter sp.]|nr:hypothetical protein [Methylobacter sp.]MDP2169658.1 hypothetical protein [Rhodocyclaceae bacterium]MDP2429029.1 hypothetical protein [Methylobacter sp.]MDP3056530.1 hypothetical protein [Methylobacter sp.]MDP3362019.1 hypothetical protein [Methylobacter sp.]